MTLNCLCVNSSSVPAGQSILQGDLHEATRRHPKARIHLELRKPLYGLDDASRKFWLKVKETLLDLNLKVMDGDKGF